jgi:hypothetical protein
MPDTQNSYARLLKDYALGEGLYFPARSVEIGDVAYFTGGQYHCEFNILKMYPEVSATRMYQAYSS